MTDTPSSLSGQGGKFIAVNSAGNALVPVDAPSGGSGGGSTGAVTLSGTPDFEATVNKPNGNQYYDTGYNIKATAKWLVFDITLAQGGSHNSPPLLVNTDNLTTKGVGNNFSSSDYHTVSDNSLTVYLAKSSSGDLLVAGGGTPVTLQIWEWSEASGGGSGASLASDSEFATGTDTKAPTVNQIKSYADANAPILVLYEGENGAADSAEGMTIGNPAVITGNNSYDAANDRQAFSVGSGNANNSLIEFENPHIDARRVAFMFDVNYEHNSMECLGSDWL